MTRPLPGLALLAAITAIAAPARADPSARDAVAARFASDADASKLALDLFDTDADVVDVLPAQRFDGGYHVCRYHSCASLSPTRRGEW